MKKKLYRSVFVLEVLSDRPLDTEMSLEEVARECNNGDLSGMVSTKVMNKVVKGKKAADLVQAQGSDPLFFQMNEEGNEIDDDYSVDYISHKECVESGQHLSSCDNDGCCNHCGEQ